MNFRHLSVLVVLLIIAFIPALSLAQYANEATDNTEPSHYQNPAQAQKAESLTREATRNSDDPELAQRIENAEKARQDLTEARQDLADLPENVDEDQRRAAIKRVRQARRDLREARALVAESLSRISGEYAESITKMRENGYGWGEIAHELGVHPSVLGRGYKHGHTKGYHTSMQSRRGHGKKGAFAASTTRDFKSGWGGKGYGVSHGVSAGGKGKGRGHTSIDSLDSSGKGKGKDGGKSAGKGSGSGGGKGSGKGGGNGKK